MKEQEACRMYSEAYMEARKEFINCMVFGFVGLGIPYYFAFTEWLPKMKQEKAKALAQLEKQEKQE